MNNKCKVIQDLLPNYIEDLTSKETNLIIEEHIKECDKCKEIYESMKENEKHEENENKKVNLLKKVKNKIKILKIIIILFLAVFIVVVLRRIAIMEILKVKYNNICEENLNNYYMRTETYDGKNINITEKYYKDGEYIIKQEFGEFNRDTSMITAYKSDNEEIKLFENKENKIKSKNIIAKDLKPISEFRDFSSNIQYALFIGIDNVSIGNKDYYVIRNNKYERYISKETGLVEKEIDFNNNMVTNYFYEFGTVDDNDIQKPDLEGFEEK